MANGDPRLLLEECYGTHEGYVWAVKKAANNAAAQGYLLQEDADALVAAAAASRQPLPRAPVGAPGGPPPRNTANDIWAADIHMTPDGKFLYISERTSSTLAAFSVNADTGKLTYLGSTPTERQPRGFAIDPKGRFLVASGEQSDTISTYAIDQASGALRLIGKYPVGKDANWVEIVSPRSKSWQVWWIRRKLTRPSQAAIPLRMWSRLASSPTGRLLPTSKMRSSLGSCSSALAT